MWRVFRGILLVWIGSSALFPAPASDIN
ncbi:unnamed protein product [Linum tenue]|uniref:Uncharacterized protein n=1 Tax=Linum tenue TaxID=586396 RepID=A0AAV0RVY0_9ROSI|nr:unnamed protein product [Linum tenue]CAI0560845.1 unnamed protein product [Linum tenue]